MFAHRVSEGLERASSDVLVGYHVMVFVFIKSLLDFSDQFFFSISALLLDFGECDHLVAF